jgi:hypothetical protein
MKAARRRDFAARVLAVLGALAAASALAESGGVTTTSRPVRLLRHWDETVKAPNGRDYVRHVELVFDYSKGFAQERYSWEDIARRLEAIYGELA